MERKLSMIQYREIKRVRPGVYTNEEGKQIKITDIGLYYEIKGNNTFYNSDVMPYYSSDEELEEIFNNMWKNLKGDKNVYN